MKIAAATAAAASGPTSAPAPVPARPPLDSSTSSSSLASCPSDPPSSLVASKVRKTPEGGPHISAPPARRLRWYDQVAAEASNTSRKPDHDQAKNTSTSTSTSRWAGVPCDDELNPHPQFLPISYYQYHSQTHHHQHSHQRHHASRSLLLPDVPRPTVGRILDRALHAVNVDARPSPFNSRNGQQRRQGCATDPFPMLPDDVLGMCLCSGYLNSLEVWHVLRLVSRRFRMVADQYARSMDLRKCKVASPNPIPFIKLSSLDLSFCQFQNDDPLRFIAHLTPTLTSLKLKGTGITGDQLKTFFASSSSSSSCGLEELDLGVVKKEHSGNITDNCLRMIASSCPRLTRLSIAWCKKVTDAGIQALFHPHSRLLELDASLTGISSESCRMFAASRLQILDASATRIDDDGLYRLAQSDELVGTRFRFLPHISAPGLAHLVEKCPRLVHLHVEHSGEEVSIRSLVYPLPTSAADGDDKSSVDSHLLQLDRTLRQRRQELLG